MSFHTSYMTCLPQELILAIFDMFTNISDIINLAESNDYVFAIYKANIDKVVKQLINKNKVYNKIWSFYYNKYYNNNNENYINSIDTKLDIVKKISNYLSNMDSFDLQCILNLEGKDVEKVFELNEEYSLTIAHSVFMIEEFDETQIEKTKRLIHDENLYSEIAFDLVEKSNDAEIELFIKLSKIFIKKGYKNNHLTLIFIATNHRDETELNIMIKLAENNFETDHLIHITNELVDNDNYDESSIMKCVELKNKGISEEHINDLVEANIHKEFNYEYYESLIKNNHTPKEAIRIIRAEHKD
jgi:hypothetical protein